MKLWTGMFIAAALLAPAPALAQDGTAAPPGDCEVRPDQTPGTDTTDDAERNDDDSQQAAETLTQKLDPCNGVLDPPPVGDSEMAEPAPDIGETPVIRPNEVKPQPPAPN